jgi:hypothetical protein
VTAVEQYQPRTEITPASLLDPTGGRLVAWAGAATAAHQLAQSLSKTSFVPRAFQGNAADATAAIILGDELGLSPLSALRSIYIISGTPALYARTMVALAMSHGHEVWTESSTDSEVVVCGRRRGSEHIERVTWNIARARKAGYTNNKKYDTDPQAMLWAKAAGEVARKIAADVLSGVPLSVEDLELEPENQPKTSVTRASRPVQRRQPPPTPEPDFDEPAPPADEPAEEPVKTTTERLDAILSDAQLKALNAGLTGLGIKDREVKLATVSQIIDREIESSKDLTRAEASLVLDWIKHEEAADTEPTLPDGAA